MDPWGLLMPTDRDSLLQLIRAHQPIKNHKARMQLTLRWVATGALVGLLPLSLWLLFQHASLWSVSGVTLTAIFAIGILALVIGTIAQRRDLGAQWQWGSEVLNEAAIQDFIELADRHAPIQEAVDVWLARWLGENIHLRNVDLLFLRHAVHLYEASIKSQAPAKEGVPLWRRPTVTTVKPDYLEQG